jgi:hypothetical protein
LAWLEVRSKGRMDRVIGKILVLVTSYMGENPIHRKHKVFFATLVSGELVDPKLNANHNSAKGKHVNIHAPRM